WAAATGGNEFHARSVPYRRGLLVVSEHLSMSPDLSRRAVARLPLPRGRSGTADSGLVGPHWFFGAAVALASCRVRSKAERRNSNARAGQSDPVRTSFLAKGRASHSATASPLQGCEFPHEVVCRR